jgi:hypothetical protein
LNGRGGEIRTPDPLLPKQMRYQAAQFSMFLRVSPKLLQCHGDFHVFF